MIDYILLAVSVLITAGGILWRSIVMKKIRTAQTVPKKFKRQKLLTLILIVIGAYLFLTRLVTLIFGKGEKSEFSVDIWAPRVNVLGLNLSTTIVYTWIVMAFLIICALLVRIFVIPRMKDVPRGAQNVLETALEFVEKYTKSKTQGLGDGLVAYIFTIAAFFIGCAALELFGLRAPTADITLTFAAALITFVLINYYGIKRKGIGGRIKTLSNPTPVVLPIKIICDCAIPVSMACRLFGNMLGGMIVMDLIYMALGNNAVGIPSVVGLYFNVFHPLIQAFIFVTLTLTFINEATE